MFEPFDARPVAERDLAEDVRLFVLDQWEAIGRDDDPPKRLTIYVPEGSEVDPEAVRSASHKTMEAFTGRYRHAVPTSQRQRVTALVGFIVFLASIVVIGWVALWAPAPPRRA